MLYWPPTDIVDFLKKALLGKKAEAAMDQTCGKQPVGTGTGRANTLASCAAMGPAAAKHAAKLVEEKLGKGYVEVK
jgi:hypothetical protein